MPEGHLVHALERVYLVAVQVEGTIQELFAFHVYESAVKKAAELASTLTRETDDVRVFELQLKDGKLTASTVHVPDMR